MVVARVGTCKMLYACYMLLLFGKVATADLYECGDFQSLVTPSFKDGCTFQLIRREDNRTMGIQFTRFDHQCLNGCFLSTNQHKHQPGQAFTLYGRRVLARVEGLDLLAKLNPQTKFFQFYNFPNYWTDKFKNFPSILLSVDGSGRCFFSREDDAYFITRLFGRIKGSTTTYHLLVTNKAQRFFMDTWTLCAKPIAGCGL